MQRRECCITALARPTRAASPAATADHRVAALAATEDHRVIEPASSMNAAMQHRSHGAWETSCCRAAAIDGHRIVETVSPTSAVTHVKLGRMELVRQQHLELMRQQGSVSMAMVERAVGETGTEQNRRGSSLMKKSVDLVTLEMRG